MKEKIAESVRLSTNLSTVREVVVVLFDQTRQEAAQRLGINIHYVKKEE